MDLSPLYGIYIKHTYESDDCWLLDSTRTITFDLEAAQRTCDQWTKHYSEDSKEFKVLKLIPTFMESETSTNQQRILTL